MGVSLGGSGLGGQVLGRGQVPGRVRSRGVRSQGGSGPGGVRSQGGWLGPRGGGISRGGGQGSPI